MFTNFDISILLPGMPVEPETLESKGLGGAESAGLYMAKALAKQGANVSVFCNTQAIWADDAGARYLPHRTWPDFVKATPHDVCIVQRTPEAFAHETNARLNLLWCHDEALGRNKQRLCDALWNVDRVLVLSRYMRDRYREVYGLDDDVLLLTRNGLDLALFHELRLEGIARDPKKLMYTARPERGLDILLRHVMPRLLAKDPALQLYLATYDLPSPSLQAFLDECDALADQLGDRVVRLGSLSKRELYGHYLSARAYLYPTPSPVLPNLRESSSISALECQAAGLPIVTSALGALNESVTAGAGVLLPGDPSDPTLLPAYIEAFTHAALRLIDDDATWSEASACGVAHTEQLDWSEVARKWLTDFESLIEAGNASPARLVRHFVRRSDFVAASAAVERVEDSDRDDLQALLSAWSFADDAQRVRQLEHSGREGDDAQEALEFETLLLELEHWFAATAAPHATVLDYACGDGTIAIGLAQRFEQLRVHGVDHRLASLELATAWAKEVGLGERATFSRLEADAASTAPTQGPLRPEAFDCALLEGLLARARAPWSTLERVERYVRRGGAVHLSVPFGPWPLAREGGGRTPNFWSFDAHDLVDMIGAKQNLTINPLRIDDDPVTGEARGWWIASYTADHRPIGTIDLERHLWLQRPRHSVSATIIAGPDAEETLHWMLRSIRNVADEIVIADCGMNEEALRIAGKYASRIVRGVDPKRHGFERARNIALEASRCDWCLWIDTDERLVGADALTKYLRENRYHAYGISQHHHTCDASLPIDTPCRLFRRRPYAGRALQFRGAIHEHPSLALDEGPGPSIVLPDVHIAHVGYLSESTRRARFARNWPLLKLDQKRYPERLLQKHFVMRDTLHVVRYAMEQNGGRLDEPLQRKCREVVELYRTHFLGKPHVMKRESLDYYSQALALLGEGFDAVFQIEADKVTAKPGRAERYRFASSDDLYAELKMAAGERAAQFDGRSW